MKMLFELSGLAGMPTPQTQPRHIKCVRGFLLANCPVRSDQGLI